MELNKKILTEEEKLQKLRRVGYKAAESEKARVFLPTSLEKENTGLVLEGFLSDQPVSFNVTDFYPPTSDPEYSRYPFFRKMGAGFIGYFIGLEALKNLDKKSDGSFNKAILDDPDEALQNLEQVIGKEWLYSKTPFLIGFPAEDKQVFYCIRNSRFEPCKTESYSLSLDVFSRNTGILETGMMKSMTAIISGCGSVGSYVALELARSGVGRFLLIDNDVVSYANVCRHQCGIADVGRYKVNAVADRIRLINPEAIIGMQNTVVENVPPSVFSEFCGPDAIIIGCADNRQGDLFASKIAAHYNMPMASVGFWERAFAGEVFYWIPERTDLACYQCFINALGDISGRQSVNRRFYTTETDLSKVNFMPGISVDITFVTNIGVKIILDILNRNNSTFIPRLIDSLTQFSLIANTQKQEIGGEQAAIFSYPLQVTTSIEVQKTAGCKICNKTAN
jgi:molybdopterin/thiamine biosynthesis adenylyltransferase